MKIACAQINVRDLILILQIVALLACDYVTNLGISEQAKLFSGFQGLFPSLSSSTDPETYGLLASQDLQAMSNCVICFLPE